MYAKIYNSRLKRYKTGPKKSNITVDLTLKGKCQDGELDEIAETAQNKA
jgi:hypothetical protein